MKSFLKNMLIVVCVLGGLYFGFVSLIDRRRAERIAERQSSPVWLKNKADILEKCSRSIVLELQADLSYYFICEDYEFSTITTKFHEVLNMWMKTEATSSRDYEYVNIEEPNFGNEIIAIWEKTDEGVKFREAEKVKASEEKIRKNVDSYFERRIAWHKRGNAIMNVYSLANDRYNFRELYRVPACDAIKNQRRVEQDSKKMSEPSFYLTVFYMGMRKEEKREEAQGYCAIRYND